MPKPTPDAKAAHELLTELRTRISTQRLPYQYGIEKRALISLWEVFTHARKAMHDNPGCERFAARATDILNFVLRPFTGKWDRVHEEGGLNSRDGGDEFRKELLPVQTGLQKFARELHFMAYGKASADRETPDVMSDELIDELFQPVRFGCVPSVQVGAADAEAITRDEAQSVQARRLAQFKKLSRVISHERRRAFLKKIAKRLDAVGLALSGGGIRSASFSLGVVQVLAQRGMLDEVDFLSTVSGGGYTGSFLSQRLGHGESCDTLAAPQGPDTGPIRYVRQNARYLSGYNLKERWSMVCETVAGMLLNWAAPLLIVVVLALIAHGCGEIFVEVRPTILLRLAGATVLTMGIYGAGMRMDKAVSDLTGKLFGRCFAATLLVAATWALDAVCHGFLHLDDPGVLAAHWKATLGGAGLSLGIIGTLLPAVTRFVPVFKNPVGRQAALQVALWIAGLFVPCLAVALFYVLLGVPEDDQVWLYVTAAVLAVVSFLVVDINLTAPHRLYRDCLARAFVWTRPGDTDAVPLKKINPEDTAPYHLLNAALNVPSSEMAALKDRGCDFFLFSKHWTGSAATHYHPTAEWKINNGKDLDLATAMAVSGAAFSTHMGLGSMPTLTALLTVLNVRLGFWIKHPGRRSLFDSPGFACLARETLGFQMREDATWLNLSDGGHIENMGVYELLRRRCKFIVCVDGEADPEFKFQGLMTLVRHARIDFGVTIAPLLDDLRPDAAVGYSKSHFHLCRIEYPGIGQQAATGLLLYLKLSVTGNESELIRRYRTNHRNFPHETTLDQFFDQEQFEAYRQLGVHAAEGLFKPALLGDGAPRSVPEWFRRLAKNLLEPPPGASPTDGQRPSGESRRLLCGR